MKTIGKAMKRDRYTKRNESKALREALKTYRQTPHPGIPLASMMFRDGLTQEKMLKTQAWEQGVFGVGFHQKIFSLGIFILL